MPSTGADDERKESELGSDEPSVDIDTDSQPEPPEPAAAADLEAPSARGPDSVLSWIGGGGGAPKPAPPRLDSIPPNSGMRDMRTLRAAYESTSSTERVELDLGLSGLRADLFDAKGTLVGKPPPSGIPAARPAARPRAPGADVAPSSVSPPSASRRTPPTWVMVAVFFAGVGVTALAFRLTSSAPSGGEATTGPATGAPAPPPVGSTPAVGTSSPDRGPLGEAGADARNLAGGKPAPLDSPVTSAAMAPLAPATPLAAGGGRAPAAGGQPKKEPAGAATPGATPTPPPVATQPAPAEPAGGRELDKAAARSAMGRGSAAASKCAADESGGANVAVTFAPSGRATSVRIDGGRFAGTATGSCIISAFKGLSVPAFDGSPVILRANVSIRK
jgi:hypothetical protein